MNNDSTLKDPTLTTQGETIVNALIQRGYNAQKLDQQLAWEVSQSDKDWWMLLTFVPCPVAQWRLLPAVHDDNQTKLYSIIQQTIEIQKTIDCCPIDRNSYAKGGRKQATA